TQSSSRLPREYCLAGPSAAGRNAGTSPARIGESHDWLEYTHAQRHANLPHSVRPPCEEPACVTIRRRQRNHSSGRQATAATPSASPGSPHGAATAFQLRPASTERKTPRLLAA